MRSAKFDNLYIVAGRPEPVQAMIAAKNFWTRGGLLLGEQRIIEGVVRALNLTYKHGGQWLCLCGHGVKPRKDLKGTTGVFLTSSATPAQVLEAVKSGYAIITAPDKDSWHIYDFPTLDEIITASGRILCKHREDETYENAELEHLFHTNIGYWYDWVGTFLSGDKFLKSVPTWLQGDAGKTASAWCKSIGLYKYYAKEYVSHDWRANMLRRELEACGEFAIANLPATNPESADMLEFGRDKYNSIRLQGVTWISKYNIPCHIYIAPAGEDASKTILHEYEKAMKLFGNGFRFAVSVPSMYEISVYDPDWSSPYPLQSMYREDDQDHNWAKPFPVIGYLQGRTAKDWGEGAYVI